MNRPKLLDRDAGTAKHRADPGLLPLLGSAALGAFCGPTVTIYLHAAFGWFW
jgi:hypothetical protein